MSYLLYMLPYQIDRAVKEQWPVVIPSGCIEFHGNHLPLGTDLIIPEEIIKLVEPHVNIVICPSIAYGPTGYCVAGPETGTIDVRVNAFKEHVKDILMGLYRTGFRNIIVLQHHQGPDGPQGTSYKMAAAEIFNEFKNTYGEGWYTKNYDKAGEHIYLRLKVMGSSARISPWPGSHGALGETEPMLVLKPENVEMDRLKQDDYPWNWWPGKEADKSSFENGKPLIEAIVIDWIDFLTENYPQTRKADKEKCVDDV
jgi:creatinine amidohydrolase